MIWTLKELLSHAQRVQAQINGKWVPVRPVEGSTIWRAKAAWAVLTGKADAFTWPEEQ